MTGLVRKATLLTACGLLVAAWAAAGVPNPAKTVAASAKVIATAGRDGASGAPNPMTEILSLPLGAPPVPIPFNNIVVRDIGDQPVAGSSVVIDFQPCNTTDIQVCSVQTQAGITTLCGGGFRNLTLSANGSGVAFFKIIGNSNSSTGAAPAGATTACAKVYADGILVLTAKVATYDYDGIGGSGSSDLNRFFAEPAVPVSTRGDYDGDGVVGSTDLFLFFKGNSTDQQSSCAAALCIP
jgi:hypothetical protein